MRIKRYIEAKQHYIPPIKRPYIAPQVIVEEMEDEGMVCATLEGSKDGMGNDPHDSYPPPPTTDPLDPNDPYDPFTSPAKSVEFNDFSTEFSL